jgi:hypothetical protein
MEIAVYFLIFLFNWVIVYQQEPSKSILITVSDKEITVDGIPENKEWASIDSIAGFSAPWSLTGQDHTVFKCFCSNTCFYFYFDVEDKTIITYDFQEELTVSKEDRVELFFSSNSDLRQYYCIEMDPVGHILDYSAQYYRKFDEDWNFTKVKIAAQFTPRGYIVEGGISLSELEKTGIKESFSLGIFRADFRSTKTDDVVWYSWIKPKSPSPDFHIPSALGRCNLKKS